MPASCSSAIALPAISGVCSAGFATTLLRGMARGLFSLVAFCGVAAWLLPSQPLLPAFGAAVAACLLVQLATLQRAS